MGGTEGSKDQLRARIRETLRSIPVEDRARAGELARANAWEALASVGRSGEGRTFQMVAAYEPFPAEIDPRPLAGRLGAKTCLPLASGDAMEMICDGTPVDPATIDIVIVPGLAFTASGERLGRGRGHYDRYLPRCERAIRLSLAHELQIVGSMPVDPWDQPVHLVVTETRWIRGKLRFPP